MVKIEDYTNPDFVRGVIAAGRMPVLITDASRPVSRLLVGMHDMDSTDPLVPKKHLLEIDPEQNLKIYETVVGVCRQLRIIE